MFLKYFIFYSGQDESLKTSSDKTRNDKNNDSSSQLAQLKDHNNQLNT